MFFCKSFMSTALAGIVLHVLEFVCKEIFLLILANVHKL